MQKIIFILNLKCQVSIIAIKIKHSLDAIYLFEFIFAPWSKQSCFPTAS